jgi:hypothetical protein
LRLGGPSHGPPKPRYLSVDDLTAPFAGIAALGIGPVGTMRCTYFVPFHITHGPPAFGSVGKASNWAGSVGRTMMCGPATTH